MLDETLGWLALATSLLAFLSTLAALYTWPRGTRSRCPGPTPSVLRRARPIRFFRRGHCWYDLTGLRLDAEESVRCPECGCIVHRRRLLAKGRRVRLGRVAALLTLLAISSTSTRWIRGESWTSVLPDLPLVMLAHTDYASFRTPLRREISDRVYNGDITGAAARTLAQAIVEELREDDVGWNAGNARDMLECLWPDSKDVLERELEHGDAQSRTIAIRVLTWKSRQPSEPLIKAWVAQLCADRGDIDWYIDLGSARSAVHHLAKWSVLAEPYVLQALGSKDEQQRLLAAGLAGYGQYQSRRNEAVAILISHLGHNDRRGDAKLAAPALYNFGPTIVPMLLHALPHPDEQAHRCLLHIVERLEHPDRSAIRCVNKMPVITRTISDPLGFSRIDGAADDVAR